jgi:DNA-binding NtrC family response regulator
VELLADRFAIRDAGHGIDLATGDPVEIIISSSGAVLEQSRWADQCDRFMRLHHRRLARLVDYGSLGQSQRFEAWRCDGPWAGSADEAAHAIHVVQRFVSSIGVSAGDTGLQSVRSRRGVAVVLPQLPPNEETRQQDHVSDDLPLECRGLDTLAHRALGPLREVLLERSARGPRVLALWGPSGAGLTTAVRELARVARMNGYVPMSLALGQGLTELARTRSLFLIGGQALEEGWRCLLQSSLRAPRSHVLLLLNAREAPGVHGLVLERLAPEALCDAIRPRARGGPVGREIARAARRSNGLPGRFAALLWGPEDRLIRSITRLRTAESRAAERAAYYGPGHQETRPQACMTEIWPMPGELVALRRRMALGAAQVEAGRHAPGERTLRHAVGSLARRNDWLHAGLGGLALARSLIKRGRPHEARVVLAEARRAMTMSGQNDVLIDVAVETGRAWIEEARLDEGEIVLRTALAAARGLTEAARVRRCAALLARCLFWEGRYEEADRLLTALPSLRDEQAAVHAALRARLAVGFGNPAAAVAHAARAAQLAEPYNAASLAAQVAYASAFAHLAVGDSKAVERDVELCVGASRRAHDPILAVRARLLAAENSRRAGRPAAAARLVARLSRVAGGRLPEIVRARTALLADLLSAPSVAATVERHVNATGLAALTLFATASPGVSGTDHGFVAEVVEILRCCQMADDDLRVLAAVCARVRRRLGASGVGFFSNEQGGMIPLAIDGNRIDDEIALRVAGLAQAIDPHRSNDRIEGGVPIHYAGQPVGVLVARWPLGDSQSARGATPLLVTTAAAVAPILAAVKARRSSGPGKGVSELLGISAAIGEIRDAVERAALAPFPVVIVGESGCGKELVARALHRRSPRRDRPFSALNCAALPEDLLEAELFGHARGAFTGAVVDRPGVFEEAHAGTLLLDEVGELSPRAQAKLLRTIQEGEVRRLGENFSRRVDVRLVAATNRDLRQEVCAGRFREDLFYRLDVIRIAVPPLRDRREDVTVLAEIFWREAASRLGSQAVLAASTLAALARYDWPGNVRELQNVLAALAVRSPRRGVVPPTALPPHFDAAQPCGSWRLVDARRTFDAQFVRAALARAGGHRERAAEELGVSRQGLSKLIARLGLNDAT